jgi:hypothetical protein
VTALGVAALATGGLHFHLRQECVICASSGSQKGRSKPSEGEEGRAKESLGYLAKFIDVSTLPIELGRPIQQAKDTRSGQLNPHIKHSPSSVNETSARTCCSVFPERAQLTAQSCTTKQF